MKEKSTILIVDDSELNRTILADILGDEYNFIEAENGARAIELLRTHTDIDLILLDMVMPEMNGFDVLTAMNNNRQIEDIPVVMISAENGIEHIERAYDLGVTDYISRPFDRMVVRRRVVNALILAAKQKRLMRLAAEQIYEKEKISDLMINIFSHIVEFRNGESGPHVLHIRTITEVLLSRLVQKTDRYSLTQEDIQLISSASALHDIGKVSIPDEIINKPGKLTKEEFEIMKSHTTVGADILHDLPFSNEEPLLKTAYEIARWHHERYDGRGYPDGLTGEEIPIAAQVVSVADVYDALTSVRCYKSAYDHETALRMIVNGECGTFNPLLLECLLDASLQIRERLREANEGYMHSTVRTQQLSTEMMLKQATPQVGRSIQALETERIKTDFFAKQSCGIQFDYDAATRTISVTDHTDTLPFGSRLYDAADTEKFTIFSKDDLHRLENALYVTTRDAPDVSMPITLRFPENGWEHEYMLAARALWSSDAKPRYLGAVGQFREMQTDIMLPEMALPDSGAVTGRQLAASMEGMSRIFDVVRLVDPKRGEILQLNTDGTFSDRVLPCSPVWNHGKRCSRCISCCCMEDKTRMSKLELTDECAYQLISRYLVVDGRECVLELGSRLSDSVWVTSGGRQFRLDASHGEDFYLDPVTGAYGRRYLEDQQPELEKAEALAVIDIDNFKEINDEYGHLAGDAVLRHVANIILARVNTADTLVRYGGDEFVLLLSHIPAEKFRSTLERIRGAVYTTAIPQYENIHPTVSIGGVYQAHPLVEAIRRADKLMYWAKQKRNDVQT